MAKRGKGNVSKTAAMEDANIGTNAPILGTDHIKKAPADVVADTKPVIKKDSGFLPRVYPGTVLNRRYGPRNALPPSMKGGAPHAEGYQKRQVIGNTGRQKNWGWTGTPSLRAKGGRIGAKKGGSVTGAAKRGFGRALKKK